MSGYQVGYIIGSLSTKSINRTLAKALIRLAPKHLMFVRFRYGIFRCTTTTSTPITRRRARAQGSDRRSGRGAFRNARIQPGHPRLPEERYRLGQPTDGTNSFAHKPSAVIGASPGEIGTAVGQQSLRNVLCFCNSPLMEAPEAYIQFTPGLITEAGEVTDKGTEQFLSCPDLGCDVRT